MADYPAVVEPVLIGGTYAISPQGVVTADAVNGIGGVQVTYKYNVATKRNAPAIAAAGAPLSGPTAPPRPTSGQLWPRA
jgi:hypothetical protein